MLSDNEYEALNSIRSAARMGDVNKLQELCLQYKGNSELLSEKKGDFMGLTPLHWAVSSGVSSRKECVKVLIDSGASIDVCNRYKNKPFFYYDNYLNNNNNLIIIIIIIIVLVIHL